MECYSPMLVWHNALGWVELALFSDHGWGITADRVLYVVLIVKDCMYFMYVCVFMYVLWRHISVNTFPVYLACEWVYIAVCLCVERERGWMVFKDTVSQLISLYQPGRILPQGGSQPSPQHSFVPLLHSSILSLFSHSPDKYSTDIDLRR